MPLTAKTAMIDPFKETMLTMAKAARKVPGRPVSSQTVYRWHNIGIVGIKLDAVVIGGRMQTSQEAMARFFVAVTEAKQSALRTETEAGERSDAVQRKLEAAGLA